MTIVPYKKFLPKGLYDAEMEPGYDAENKRYDRKLQVRNGMNELMTIVAGLQKEVKRLNNCLTLPDAKKWIERNKKKNWQAHEMDITGPDGRPDGIPEVFITDGHGNMKVINGWTLSKSHYPERKFYRSVFTDPELRKAFPYTEYRRHLNDVKEDEPIWRNMTDKDGNVLLTSAQIKKIHGNKLPTARQIFKSNIFAAAWGHCEDQWATEIVYNRDGSTKEVQKVPPMAKAQVYNRVLAATYAIFVEWPVINKHYRITNGESGRKPQLDDKEYQKIRRDKNFEAHCEQQITDIMNNQEKLNNIRGAIVDHFLREMIDNENNQAVNGNGIQPKELIDGLINDYNNQIIANEGGAQYVRNEQLPAAISAEERQQQLAAAKRARNPFNLNKEYLQKFQSLTSSEKKSVINNAVRMRSDYAQQQGIENVSEVPMTDFVVSAIDNELEAQRQIYDEMYLDNGGGMKGTYLDQNGNPVQW